MPTPLIVAEVAPLSDAVPGALTYLVPEALRASVQPGVVAVVPLRKRLVAGVVLSAGPLTRRPEFALKPVHAVADAAPALGPVQIELARWIAEEYHAALGRCCALMIPPGLTPKSARVYALAAGDGRPAMDKPQGAGPAPGILDLLRRRGPMVESRLAAALRGAPNWRQALKELVDAGAVTQSATLESITARPVRTTLAQLAISAETLDIVLGNLRHEAERQPRRAEALRRRAEALTYLAQRNGFAWADWIAAETGASRADLAWLAERDYLILGDAERWRDPLAEVDYVVKTPPPLTEDQARAWESIRKRLEVGDWRLSGGAASPIPNLFLLRGVTGSGKTEIYMRAVELALQQGRGAIVLVPEISLTPQTARRFLERFPARVALIHSRLKPGERYDTWRRIRSGELPVVVGARSALFAPLRDPGVIVIDEEHDQSYKQGAPPYYHTRDVAIQYARLNGATLILGSATPSLEVWLASSNLQSPISNPQSLIKLLELPNRVRGHVNRIGDQQARLGVQSVYVRETDAVAYQPMPDVRVVDMRAELRGGNTGMFSGALRVALAETFQRGEQAILFLNRRGSASCVLCRDCGFAVRCPNDDLPLTYHEESRKEEGGSKSAPSARRLLPSVFLKCHTCNHMEPVPAACPSCGGPRIRFIGIGTQKVEQAIREQFPAARVVRWDRDSASGRSSADQMLKRFVDQQADALVGTQMIAKGLDLPLVTLVGVVLADVGLFLPDFRASERVFDLIAQVAGRAGRGLLAGRVIVQTYNPDHPAITFAARHDVSGFARHELAQRKTLNLPPYTRLVRFEIAREDNDRARQECEMLARQLRRRAPQPSDVIGPAQAYFARRNNQYRWQVLARAPSPRALLAGLDVPGDFVVDVDPISVL